MQSNTGRQRFWCFAAILFLGIACSPLPLLAAETYLDLFNARAYNNSSGTSDWSTNSWQEIGDDGSPTAGTVQVVNHVSNYQLRIQGTSKGARRQANLSGATAATLSFDYSRNYNAGNEYIYIYVSGNGGSTWTQLDRFSNNNDGTTYLSASYDITSSIAANTMIRFESSASFDAPDLVYFDNVQILYTLPVAVMHFAVGHDGNGDTCNPENVVISYHDASHAVITSYTGTIALATSTSHGDWAVNPADPAAGTFNNLGNGGATYTFAPADNGSVTLDLSNTFTETQSINITDGTSSEDAAEDSILVFSGSTINTYTDNFDTVSLAGNNGSVNWAANWQEIGDDGNAASGDIRVTNVDSAFHLRIQDASNEIQRQANLTGATSATLTFQYKRYYNNGAEKVEVYASGNGGSSWTKLDTYSNSIDASYQSASYDITGYIAANTMIRLVSNSSFDATDWIHFDNVQIQTSSPLNCGGVDHFDIDHDGSGINCLAEPITVIAEYADNTTVLDYTGSITLNTNTGKGTWTLNTGSGSLSDGTANDGVATYSFAGVDNGTASFNLSYIEGTSPLNISVTDGTASDDNLEGTISFSPSGFTMTAAEVTDPTSFSTAIPARTAGTAFTMHLTAYGQTPTDPTCGIIEAYTGAKNIKFWSTYSDPASGTVQATVDTISIAAAEGSAVARSVTFAAGKASVAVKYKDVGRIQVSMKDDTVTEPAAGIAGASDLFVVKPAGFVLSGIKRTGDSFANPGAANENGAVFTRAGEDFSVTVTVRDSEGAATPNFGREAAAETVLLSPTIVAAGSANNPAISFATGFDFSAANGTGIGTDFSWGEVGIITLTPGVGDGSYLGAGDVTGTVSGNVGRFTPFDFNVAGNVPNISPGCAGAVSFTYVGQPLSYSTAPSVTITARNQAGATTMNYDNAWWKLADFTETYSQDAGTPLPGTVTLDSSSAGHAAISCSNCDGTLTVPFTGTLRYLKGTGLPQTPFNSVIDLSLPVTDSDSVSSASNPFLFNDMAFTGGANEVRWGRLQLANAYGPETADLEMPAIVEEYTASGFSASLDDSCTSLTSAPAGPPQWGDILLPTASYTDNLAEGETSPSVSAFSLGEATITLSAPGDGNDGNVDIAIDLAATGADMAWLQHDWDGDTNHDNNPAAAAVFGIYRSNDRIINWREILR